MKKILLSTVLPFVFAAPAWAEDVSPMLDATESAVQQVVVETADGVLKAETVAMSEDAGEKAEAYAQEVTPDVAEAQADPAAGREVHVEEAPAAPVEMAAPVVAKAPAHSGAHWGYAGSGAAPYWGTLDEAYGLCASGQEQSPINIAKFLQEDVPDIMLSYKPSPLEVVNNGHTIQVNTALGSGFRADNVNYNLLQMHFHTPSEHYLDGAPYPMEVHFVHKADDGTLAVIGAMMKIGAHNPVIEGIWQNAPIEAGASKHIDSVEINAADLMPASLEYYKYDGSLTTPPCSEGVRWHVLKEPIELSEMQLKAFQALFPVNARPVQSLNERVVTGD